VTYVTRIGDALYGVYASIVFIICVIFGLFVALLVPGADRRATWLANTTRAIFVLSAAPVEVHGLNNLPAADCVVVSNHASYVDGFLLKGFLPGRFSFVIKGEMRNIPLVHFQLRRAGSRFVERNDSAASSRDARQIVKAAQSGQSLAIFPEGTFQREPGLMRLRAGAFVAAVRGEMPIVPVVISGTRYVLPAKRYLPRYGRIRVDILAPITPDHPSYSHHRELAKTVRQRIIAVLDEPDLVDSETLVDFETNSSGANE
jgi:1-acyl-sn-glycerol-3-phosphate acyltransferase